MHALHLAAPVLLLATSMSACEQGLLGPSADAGVRTDARTQGEDASAGTDGAGFRCDDDDDCQTLDAGVCQTSTGQCRAATCFELGCEAGAYCNPATLSCETVAPGEHPSYRAETIAGHSILASHGVRDAVGIAALGNFSLLVASRAGRYLYILDDAILRLDQTTMRLETLSGLGWPGEVDGPADVAQYEQDFYQAGGLALSPDERHLYFTSPHVIRKVDLETGEGSTLRHPELEGLGVRSLAVGASGALYLIGWQGFVVLTAGGEFEERSLDHTGVWGDGMGGPPGFLVVDEARGWAYGLERNKMSGAFYRWPLAGGRAEWLNHAALGTRDPVQYLSDGPVANLDMANPAGMTIDQAGYVYIGAGDGRTFRRYNPDSMTVESLCHRAGVPDTENRFEWCIGDNVRNKPFGTWPHFLTFDGAGNGYFGYTVWPRLVRLTRED